MILALEAFVIGQAAMTQWSGTCLTMPRSMVQVWLLLSTPGEQITKKSEYYKLTTGAYTRAYQSVAPNRTPLYCRLLALPQMVDF
jgi:hypothetical protein